MPEHKVTALSCGVGCQQCARLWEELQESYELIVDLMEEIEHLNDEVATLSVDSDDTDL